MNFYGSAMKMFINLANRSKLEKYKQDIAGAYGLGGKSYEPHRNTMKELNNWVNSYGMSNNDEMWATAVEMFFKLPMEYRKVIIGMIMNGGDLPEKYKPKG